MWALLFLFSVLVYAVPPLPLDNEYVKITVKEHWKYYPDGSCVDYPENSPTCTPIEDIGEPLCIRVEGGYYCNFFAFKEMTEYYARQEGHSQEPQNNVSQGSYQDNELSEENTFSQIENSTLEELSNIIKSIGYNLSNILTQYFPKYTTQILTDSDFINYLNSLENPVVPEPVIETLTQDNINWDNYSTILTLLNYSTTEDEKELWNKSKDLLLKGTREQIIKKAIVEEGIEKAKQLQVSYEDYQHNVNTNFDILMNTIDLLQLGVASITGKIELIKTTSEIISQKGGETMETMGFSPDDALKLGAKYSLKIHQGYVEARATGLGYPPQRFLYGCDKKEYKNYNCKKDPETDTYQITINGEKRTISHFVRMKDDKGNVYWVGVDDPEAIDGEDVLNHATIMLKEVNGWFWKSDNVKVIDPKTGKELSEEDLPGLFG